MKGMKAGMMPECMMGRMVERHSPAMMGNRKVAQPKVEAAMREVHENMPSTVKRAKHFGPGGKEAMLRAIAFSKVRRGT